MQSNSDIIQAGIAVITGASAGLGRALAIELCRRDVRVVGFARSETGLAETAKLAGPGFTPMTVDVSDPDALRAAFKVIADTLGPVTILVNNAAVYPRRDILDESAESFAQTMAINLGGMVAATRAALDGMSETGLGHIVNVSSFADLAPLPASAAYSVSKGAGRIFSKALVADLGDRFPGIIVTTWLPGMLATDMGVPHGLSPEVAAAWGADLALWHDPDLNGALFEQDCEVLPPRSLKRRLKDKVLRSAPQPRRLGSAS